MNFASDNWAGVHPAIMDALAEENKGLASAYGSDPATQRAIARIADIFEHDVEVFFVTTGGAANGLALSVITPAYGMVLCHEESHIQMDECAGPEFFTGGAKLLPISGRSGKLTVDGVSKTFKGFPERPPHGAPISTLSLTQLTECGTAYTIDDITALAAWAHAHDLAVHMDGARFANALIATGATPAQMSWKAGIDVLCLGGTKNGCLAAEAVIFFDQQKARDFAFRRKRAGHLLSKHRFISAQFEAWFKEDLWLALARHANMMADRLSTGLAHIDGVTVAYPVEGNEVFVIMPDTLTDTLKAQGAQFYPWVTPAVTSGDPATNRPDGSTMHRLICSYATQAQEVDTFIDAVSRGVVNR